MYTVCTLRVNDTYVVCVCASVVERSVRPEWEVARRRRRINLTGVIVLWHISGGHNLPSHLVYNKTVLLNHPLVLHSLVSTSKL